MRCSGLDAAQYSRRSSPDPRHPSADYTTCMTRRSLSRLLLGLVAMLTPFVNPLASVLHGMAHAAEALQAATAVASASGEGSTLASRGIECAVEAPDHVTLHAALHRASCQDAEASKDWNAIASVPDFAASVPRAAVHAVLPGRETEPSDSVLRSRALARAPPLG